MKKKVMLFMLFFQFACSDVTKKECDDYSSKSYIYFQKYLSQKNKSDLTTSKVYLAKAFKCNRKRPLNYWIKIGMLSNTEAYDSVLIVINEFQEFYKGPDLIFTKGEIFEKVGQKDSAKAMYRLALLDFEDLHEQDPNNSSHLLVQIDITYRLEGKEKAFEKAMEFRDRYPNKEEFQNPEELIMLMDR